MSGRTHNELFSQHSEKTSKVLTFDLAAGGSLHILPGCVQRVTGISDT